MVKEGHEQFLEVLPGDEGSTKSNQILVIPGPAAPLDATETTTDETPGMLMDEQPDIVIPPFTQFGGQSPKFPVQTMP